MKFTTTYSTLGSTVFVVIALGFLPSVEAQFATCLEGWEWSYNSEGQNPCEIAGSLQAACLGFSVFVLGNISTNANYVTPQANDTNGKKCGCNTVIYTLYTACTLCQWPPNSTGLTWTFWEQYCDTVSVGYPFNIPYNASVPHWAYLDDTAGVGFDPTLAQAAGRDPEALPPVPSTVSSGSTSLPNSVTRTPTPGTATSQTPSSTSGGGGNGNDNSGHSKTNVGAIAGGVVGGVLGLAGLAALTLFILRRRDERAGADHILGPNQSAYNPNMVEPKYEQPKLYDPSDPSTFPTYVSGEDSSHSGGYVENSFQRGGYTGAPEL